MKCILKDLIELSKDGEWGKGEAFDDSVEMLAIRGTDFEDVRFGFTGDTPRRHIAKRHADRKSLRPWDVIIEAAGGTKDQITGRTVLLRPQLFSNSHFPLTCASFSRFIRFNTRLCEPEFMFWYLQHLYWSGAMHKYHTQHTGVARFQWTTFSENEPLELPTISVQQRIAGILSAYDELIENSQRRIKILEQMARNLYREWFVHFRFPGHQKIKQVDSPLGKIPHGWEAAPLSLLVDFAKGRKPAETRADALPGDAKLLLIDSLHGGQPVFTAPAKLVLAESRDTIMVMDGASSCEVTIGASGAVGSTLGRFRTTRPKVFTPHALYRFLEAKAEEFKSKNVGAAIPHANKDYILSQFIALPPEKIAARFNAQLEPIQSTIETLKAQIENLRKTRDLLLPRLMSGQINVN